MKLVELGLCPVVCKIWNGCDNRLAEMHVHCAPGFEESEVTLVYPDESHLPLVDFAWDLVRPLIYGRGRVDLETFVVRHDGTFLLEGVYNRPGQGWWDSTRHTARIPRADFDQTASGDPIVYVNTCNNMMSNVPSFPVETYDAHRLFPAGLADTPGYRGKAQTVVGSSSRRQLEERFRKPFWEHYLLELRRMLSALAGRRGPRIL